MFFNLLASGIWPPDVWREKIFDLRLDLIINIVEANENKRMNLKEEINDVLYKIEKTNVLWLGYIGSRYKGCLEYNFPKTNSQGKEYKICITLTPAKDGTVKNLFIDAEYSDARDVLIDPLVPKKYHGEQCPFPGCNGECTVEVQIRFDKITKKMRAFLVAECKNKECERKGDEQIIRKQTYHRHQRD